MDRKSFSVRYLSVVALLVVVGVSVIVKAGCTMFLDREYWEKVAARFVREGVVVKPNRGNILSADGQLMASTLPEYRIYMDFMTSEKEQFPERRRKDQHRRDTLIANHLDEICQGLHRIFPDKSAAEFKQRMILGRQNQSRNWAIYPHRISYIQYKEVKKLPVFRLNQYRGGFIGKPFNRRKKPFGSLAKRTLGDTDRNNPDSARNGLELAYDSILRGRSGLTHRQKVMDRYLNIVDVPAEDGSDIVTTIDVNMQDIAEKALVDKMKELSADMGVVVLMEVKTGEVRAMVNMSRLSDGSYAEDYNHAISTRMEPGSTFKTASMLVALDDGVIDTSDVVDTGNGVMRMHGSNMKDHNWYRGGYQTLTVPEVLMVSSNIGVSRIIDEKYGDNPTKFVEGLHRVGIGTPLELDLPGYLPPRIRFPNPTDWWKTTLPWMSIGYETQIAPINTLAFYNAIANDGVMVKPRFVKAVMCDGQVVEEYEPVVLNERICSSEALGKIQAVLESVVSRGLGKQAGSSQFRVSGKTGTAQVSQGKAGYKGGPMQYLVSFCGYFPSENPRYSCIVAIRKPGYPASGGGMAGPVFSRIAERVMAGSLKRDIAEAVDSNTVLIPDVKNGHLEDARYLLAELDVDTRLQHGDMTEEAEESWGRMTRQIKEVELVAMPVEDGRMPDVRGMGAMDAVYLIESQGLKVQLQGVGRVYKQSVSPGSRIMKGQTVRIVMKE